MIAVVVVNIIKNLKTNGMNIIIIGIEESGNMSDTQSDLLSIFFLFNVLSKHVMDVMD